MYIVKLMIILNLGKHIDVNKQQDINNNTIIELITMSNQYYYSYLCQT